MLPPDWLKSKQGRSSVSCQHQTFPRQPAATQFFIQDLVPKDNIKTFKFTNHNVVQVQPVLSDQVDTGSDTQTDQNAQSSARENYIENKNNDESSQYLLRTIQPAKGLSDSSAHIIRF